MWEQKLRVAKERAPSTDSSGSWPRRWGAWGLDGAREEEQIGAAEIVWGLLSRRSVGKPEGGGWWGCGCRHPPIPDALTSPPVT